jgi:transposase
MEISLRAPKNTQIIADKYHVVRQVT